jgi:uncharacterized protein YbjT (DUF2867 family)
VSRLVVLGASGLIGAEVCRRGVEAGASVVGVSRSARPPGLGDEWADRVRWIAANVFETAAWNRHLPGCAGVVHAIGIIRERRREGVTFERMNGDSAIVAGREAEAAGVPRFVFISAAAKPPLVADSYITAKARAEAALSRMELEATLMRPAFAVGSRRPETVAAGVAFAAAVRLPLVGRAIRDLRALPVAVIARCAVRAALEPGHGGVLDVDAIERLGR